MAVVMFNHSLIFYVKLKNSKLEKNKHKHLKKDEDEKLILPGITLSVVFGIRDS